MTQLPTHPPNIIFLTTLKLEQSLLYLYFTLLQYSNFQTKKKPAKTDRRASPRPLRLSPSATLPVRGSTHAAGYDLASAEATVIPARGKALVKTGLAVAIPDGHYGRVAPRSGLAWKHAIDVGAGVIDSDYRGPLGVILFNFSDADFEVKPGDRIAQLIIEKISTPEVVEVDDLDPTKRGAGGFGSTGVESVLKKPRSS